VLASWKVLFVVVVVCWVCLIMLPWPVSVLVHLLLLLPVRLLPAAWE
jgi:hypothetical protein